MHDVIGQVRARKSLKCDVTVFLIRVLIMHDVIGVAQRYRYELGFENSSHPSGLKFFL